METGYGLDLPTLEKVDKLIAHMPAGYTHNKRAIQLRYQYQWIVKDCHQQMCISKTTFRILLAGGEGFIDAQLTDEDKKFDKWVTTV